MRIETPQHALVIWGEFRAAGGSKTRVLPNQCEKPPTGEGPSAEEQVCELVENTPRFGEFKALLVKRWVKAHPSCLRPLYSDLTAEFEVLLMKRLPWEPYYEPSKPCGVEKQAEVSSGFDRGSTRDIGYGRARGEA